jgi:hypothetical protein
MTISVPPDQIEPFLSHVRALGRVDTFTRQSERVARDGGDPDEPADAAKTDRDNVQVNLSIRFDDQAGKQVALTVVTPTVDDALDRAKAATLAQAGAQILSSSFTRNADGESTAQVSIRVPGRDYPALLAAFRGLGRASAFNLQRDDDAGPNATGDDTPVVVALTLTDDETPLQQTELSILTTDVEAKAQQIKSGAASAGVEVKASSFEREADGTETARMTLRLPLGKYPAFVESVEQLGRVEALTVHREDRPDQARTDAEAPAEISLDLHSAGDLVPDDNGVWSTLRGTFADGAAALLGSVRTIGVVVAFLAPWAMALVLAAWTGRRIYLWQRGR